MSFLNYGAAKALSYRANYEGMIRNAVEQEQLTNAAIAQRKQEVQYYAEKMKTASSDIPSVQRRLDEFNKKKMNEIGEFVNSNPDFRLDIAKSAEFNRMTGDLLNNPIISEGETSKKHYESFIEAVRNHDLTNEEFVDFSKKWETYQESGSDGPFVFAMPKRLSIDELTTAGLAMVAPTVEAGTRGNLYGTETKYDDVSLYARAQNMLNSADYRPSMLKAFELSGGAYETPEIMMTQMMKNAAQNEFKVQGFDPIAVERIRGQIRLKEAELEAKKAGPGSSKYPGELLYVTQVLDPLTQNGITPRIEKMAYLTELGGETDFSFNDPQFHIMTLANVGGKPAAGQALRNLQDYNFNQTASVTGGGYAFIGANGMRYATVQVEFPAPSEDAEILKNYGFTPNKSKKEGMLSNPGGMTLETTSDSYPTYKGTIVVHLNESTANLRNFDKAMGVGESQMTLRDPYYSQIASLVSQAKTGTTRSKNVTGQKTGGYNPLVKQ